MQRVKFTGTMIVNRGEDIKKLGYRLRKLKNEFDILKHYWKIRVKERKTLYGRAKNAQAQYHHLIKLEKIIAKTFGRRHLTISHRRISEHAKKVYPVFLTLNDMLRLKYILRIKKVRSK